MSLHETYDGILETSVTWEDFETRLRAALGTEARLGPNKSVQDIGEGNGYASICGLVTCDWIGASEDEKLPTRVVLKIPSALPFRKLNDSLPAEMRMFDGNEAMWEMMEGKLRDVHNIEVVTYEFFEGFEGLAMPKKYYGRPFGEGEKIGGQICLEYMENSRMMNFHEKHSVELLKQIARAIGKLQACSLKKEPTAPELNKDFFAEFANTITMEAYKGMFKGMAAIDPSDSTRELMEKIDDILEDYYASNLATTLHTQLGFRPVLVNGDLRTENVLIDNDSGDLAALIDWQCTHLGVGTEDLLRIVMFALTKEDRRASISMLIEEMHKSLVENLDGAEPPYSLEKLHVLTDLLFPHCALFYAGGCIALITNQEKDLKLSDEEKAKRKEVCLDKVVGVLEDILVIHEKNKEHVMNLNLKFGNE